jgi:hypothetical protein
LATWLFFVYFHDLQSCLKKGGRAGIVVQSVMPAIWEAEIEGSPSEASTGPEFDKHYQPPPHKKPKTKPNTKQTNKTTKKNCVTGPYVFRKYLFTILSFTKSIP